MILPFLWSTKWTKEISCHESNYTGWSPGIFLHNLVGFYQQVICFASVNDVIMDKTTDLRQTHTTPYNT
jgi:hypothetical protein